MELGIEIFFFFETLSGFFIEYQPNNSIYSVRKIKKIADRYLKTEFIYDLLPLIPYRFIFSFDNSRFFYLIKVVRILQFFKVLDTSNFMKLVKAFFLKRS